ncbi:MAG: hypothetical protein PF501_04995 [Salinisphaera sp.]|nr:hypothetical protein [Salinisphaera sp.]
MRNVALIVLVLAGLTPVTVIAAPVHTVFKIVMENHDWTQPDHKFSGDRQQIKGNPNAPFINGLVDGTLPISLQVAYASHYYNVLVTNNQHNPDIHPSEPNYVWSEAGSNLGVANDHDPYQWLGGTHQATSRHLSAALVQAGYSWKSYQEDIDLQRNSQGELTDRIKPKTQWVVPLSSHAGSSGSYVNKYNASHQYSYAAKHDPQVLFDDTSGQGDVSPANPQVRHYVPLKQLRVDLKKGNVANYNVITPDEYNDMHSVLASGFTTASGEHLTGEAARIRACDHFLSIVVPEIMHSRAYKNGGLIELWWDETVGARDHGDDLRHTLPDIIISQDVHPNVNGKPYASNVSLSHSSTLKTVQEIFGLEPLLRHAGDAGVHDLSDLLAADAIPKKTMANGNSP